VTPLLALADRRCRLAHHVPSLRGCGLDARVGRPHGDGLVVLTPVGSGKVARLRGRPRTARLTLHITGA
jgi:hypothetical protein